MCTKYTASITYAIIINESTTNTNIINAPYFVLFLYNLSNNPLNTVIIFLVWEDESSMYKIRYVYIRK